MGDLLINKKDYTYLKWSKTRSSSGTAGSFLKATIIKNGKKVYYKLSNYNLKDGIIGHECVNEIIVSRLLDVLDIGHLAYRLLFGSINVDGREIETYFAESESFLSKGDRKITLEDYYELECKESESIESFIKRKRLKKNIDLMLLVDYLILNRDRHGANVELIRTQDGKTKMAPLFDHGVSLLFNCKNEREIEEYDVLEDKKVQSFIGSNSAKENLRLIDTKLKINKLEKKDKEYILDGMDLILGEKHCEKIWNMIWQRWKMAEKFLSRKGVL